MYSTANTLADCNKLSVKSGCLCQGRDIVYECAVFDHESSGLTVWKAPKTNPECNVDISLSHSETTGRFISKTNGCPNVLAEGVKMVGNCYYSELTINVSTIVTEDVRCIFDNGKEEITVGHQRLYIPMAGKLYY